MTRYLSVERVKRLHAWLIEQSGGRSGIRDEGALESAVVQPQMQFAGEELYPTLAEKAAALAYGIVQNHAFIDGNKRVTITSLIYDAQAGMAIYSLNCSDYPIAKMLDTKQKALMMLKESAKARVGGEPAELKEVEVDGYPGIEYVQRMGNAAIYHRAYLVGEKLYQLDVGDMQGGGQAGADKFFQSFSVE